VIILDDVDKCVEYCRAHIEGGDDARARAEAIAKSIETNPASKKASWLENDDEERDLNRETTIAASGGADADTSPTSHHHQHHHQSAPHSLAGSRQNSINLQPGHR
jgi:hypothetical protein